VNKKRWYAAEGGWENPFPSGSPQQELHNMQLEFALAQKCGLVITGQSNYGEKLKHHMCCGFPLHERGRLPQRCVCPPHVQLSQSGFGTCEEGNLLLCKNITVDAKTFGGASIARAPREYWMANIESSIHVSPRLTASAAQIKVSAFVNDTLEVTCRQYDRGPPLGAYCKSVVNK
jgi:hypothetical protein